MLLLLVLYLFESSFLFGNVVIELFNGLDDILSILPSLVAFPKIILVEFDFWFFKIVFFLFEINKEIFELVISLFLYILRL